MAVQNIHLSIELHSNLSQFQWKRMHWWKDLKTNKQTKNQNKTTLKKNTPKEKKKSPTKNTREKTPQNQTQKHLSKPQLPNPKTGIFPAISQTPQVGEFTAQLLCDQLLDRVDKYFLRFPLLQSWHCSSAFWKNWSSCQTAWHCSNWQF